MPNVQEQLLQKKIQELERQNAVLRREQESADLDSILCDLGAKKRRKNSPVPLMKLRKYVRIGTS